MAGGAAEAVAMRCDCMYMCVAGCGQGLGSVMLF